MPVCKRNSLLPLKAGEQTKSEQKLLQDKQYRHLLDIHELLRVTGPDNVKAVFSKSPQDTAFIKAFLQDPAWMELYLGAGLIPETPRRAFKSFPTSGRRTAGARTSGTTSPSPPGLPPSFPQAPWREN
ncbi:MAG: hypothetical protein ACLT8E_03620 [Akkermansia sp.]